MANEAFGLFVRRSPPLSQARRLGVPVGLYHKTRSAAAQKQFHSSFIRHKLALVVDNGRGMRAEGLFDLERAYGVVLIEHTSFMEVFKCRTEALGSPRIDEPSALRESLQQNEEDTTRLHFGWD